MNEIQGISLGIDERVELAQDLAARLLERAQAAQTSQEKRREQELAKMMQDHRGKAFISLMLDSCFRSHDFKRLIDQMLYLLSHYGIPSFFSWWQRAGVRLLGYGGKVFPTFSAHCIQKFVKSQLSEVIAPAENLDKRLLALRAAHIKINLNRLGEAILGEQEALKRLEQNIKDLANPYVDVISVKVSSIKSNLSLVAFDNTLGRLKEALRRLYRAANKHGKQVTLDMEEYKDLRLTVRLFQEVLSEPEFLETSAGIALQSYIPDSYEMQVQLTKWAMERKGAPIKIRIVKGANLGMERVEASIKEWPQATYKQKESVDANYKKMLHYGMQKEHAQAVHLGIGSHNLFDIAYALVLATENAIEPFVTIEMLAGMAPHLARVMPSVWNNVLLYVPCAEKDQFHNAIAYLMRRLDENTAPNNFLTHLFGLKTTSIAWNEQKELFYASCMASETVSTVPRRGHKTEKKPVNVPETDFSLPANQKLAQEIAETWKVQYHEVTLSIGGHALVSSEYAQGYDPSRPECKIHTHFLAQEYQANVALEFAHTHAATWAEVPLAERIEMLKRAAHILSQNRKKFLGAMMQEVAKNIAEADAEFSEAIDFIHYYTKDATTHAHAKTLFSVGKAALVLTPWNFPISIPTSALTSALLAGYSVIFKPAPEAILCGSFLAQAFWDAGIPKEVLQFITCKDDPVGWQLVTDPRIDTVILTGATDTAKSFLERRPTLNLYAETGGKNSLIVTKIADQDLAVKDAIHSAFGYAGQKCSALSLLILEEEVYNSDAFHRQLVDAASSLVVGSAHDLATVVNPLIRPASPHLYKALTTLDEGESWLLEPKQDLHNPQLWSPGIKLGVKPGSFMHQTELFGPVLAVMCAKDLAEAVEFANGTPYGLTAGLHSLDPREHEYWKKHIVAGNCYINRAITGAIVARQPFGGCKASSFGLGMKVGGPNYLLQLADRKNIPALGMHPISDDIVDLEGALLQLGVTEKEKRDFYKAASSMAFWWDNYFTKPRTLRYLVGQDNILSYVPHEEITVLFQDKDSLFDLFLVLAAARTAGCKVHLVTSFKQHRKLFRQGPLEKLFLRFGWNYSTMQELPEGVTHIRALSSPPNDLFHEAMDINIPSLHGRLELIHYVREVALSYDYHRYGSLMEREQEWREPLM